MKASDLYSQWEKLPPEDQKWVVSYLTAGFDMCNSGLVDHVDKKYGKYAIDLFSYALLANEMKDKRE